MNVEFLVEMRQCDKCGSVRSGDIFNLHLGSGVDLFCFVQVELRIFVGRYRISVCIKNNIDFVRFFPQHFPADIHLNFFGCYCKDKIVFFVISMCC